MNHILIDWKSSNALHIKGQDEQIKLLLNEIFLKELKVEEELNVEVEKMLSKYEKEFQSGKLDRRKMFQMIKNQLAKEKKVVL